MKFSAATALLLPASGLAAYTKDDYLSGKVHDKLMGTKDNAFADHRHKGSFDSRKWPSWDKWHQGNWKERSTKVKCKNGLAVVEPGNANQTFRCNNFDFYDFKSHADLGSVEGEGNDVWGYVSEDGREFAALGQADGVAFMEVTKKGKLVYLGRLPQQSVPSIWRDMKTIGSQMIVGTEAVGGGVQVFDMEKLRYVDPRHPVTFSTETDLTGYFDGLPRGRSHNMVTVPGMDLAAAVGAQPRTSPCAAGLIWIDMTDPSNPTSDSCSGEDGYVHDAQCLVYHGPDERYQGKPICFGFNEDTLTVYDISDRSGINTTSVIGKGTYEGASYVHQGWVLNEDYPEFLISNDELDELDGAGLAAGGRPVTYIWDIRDLENPTQTGHYFSSSDLSIDHNTYIWDKVYPGVAIHSNYGSGIQAYDITSIPSDPSGNSVTSVGFFDLYPENDATGGSVEFVGTWSNYVFPSGYLFASSIERGAFLIKMSNQGYRGKGKGKGRGN